MSGFRLKILRGEGKGRVLDPREGVVVIGRDAACQVRVDQRSGAMVSGRHAEIRVEGPGAVLADLGSTNGTWLNDARVDRAPLTPGDVIRLGQGGPEYLFLASSPGEERASVTVIVRSGARAGTRLRFRKGRITLGRNPDSDVALDPDRDTAASWDHARILVEGSVARIEDAGSSNGTFVNGRRITAPARLRSGDEVGLGAGGVVLLVQLPEPGAKPPRGGPWPEDRDAPPPGADARIATLVRARLKEVEGGAKILVFVGLGVAWVLFLAGVVIHPAAAILVAAGLVFLFAVVLRL